MTMKVVPRSASHQREARRGYSATGSIIGTIKGGAILHNDDMKVRVPVWLRGGSANQNENPKVKTVPQGAFQALQEEGQESQAVV